MRLAWKPRTRARWLSLALATFAPACGHSPAVTPPTVLAVPPAAVEPPPPPIAATTFQAAPFPQLELQLEHPKLVMPLTAPRSSPPTPPPMPTFYAPMRYISAEEAVTKLVGLIRRYGA